MLITSIQPQNETILISNKNEVYEVSFLQKLNKKKLSNCQCLKVIGSSIMSILR